MTRPSPQIARALVCLAALASAHASAAGQDDQPIPYTRDTEDVSGRTVPTRGGATARIAPEETEGERRAKETSLTRIDDPNMGLGGEVVSGLMLLESSRGALVEPRFAWGLRATCEVGRFLPGDFFRNALLADLTWSYAATKSGSQLVFSSTNYHYFTVAPAWAFPLWPDADFAGFVQLGGGISFQYSTLNFEASTKPVPVGSVKPLLQYGVGLRGRPMLEFIAPLRLSFRVEVTRLRRQYMDDTFIGGSIGATY